eukprot:3398543-Heterocapsa_arctica.AAC.1
MSPRSPPRTGDVRGSLSWDPPVLPDLASSFPVHPSTGREDGNTLGLKRAKPRARNRRRCAEIPPGLSLHFVGGCGAASRRPLLRSAVSLP